MRTTHMLCIAIGCLLCGHPLGLWAQSATGLLPEEDAYATVPMLPLTGQKTILPASVDLRPYCPLPRQQGAVQSCVGWATGYGAMTITYAIRNQLRDQRAITERAFSAMYIYQQIHQGDCQTMGARISDAMQLLQKQGNCLASQFDIDVTNCQQPISPRIRAFAQNFRIRDYLRLFAQNAPAGQKVYRLQYALAQQKPVVIGMHIRRNFLHLNEQADYWWPDIGDATPAGGHAMVVVGYDHRRNAFLLLNSWGEDWGQNGFVWIKYRVMAEYVKYAYIIEVDQDLGAFWQDGARSVVATHPLRQLGGRFDFRYNPCGDTYCGAFSPAAVERSGLFYRPLRKWTVGQQFQLTITNGPSAAYVYVFSQNPAGRISVHWPRPDALQQAGGQQTPLPPGASITVPGPDRAMRISLSGRNHLVLLLSEKPIANIHQLLAPLEGSGDQLPQKMYALLKPYLIPMPDLHLSDHQISVMAKTRSGKSVVPLILSLYGEAQNMAVEGQ